MWQIVRVFVQPSAWAWLYLTFLLAMGKSTQAELLNTESPELVKRERW